MTLDSQTSATVRKHVKRLRVALGDTQQSFAHRLGLAISTVVRYEHSRPPNAAALAQFAELATANGLPECAKVFRDALGLKERRLINMGFEVGLRLDLIAARRDVKALEAQVERLRELLKLALCLLPRANPLEPFPDALLALLPKDHPTYLDWHDIVAKIQAELLESPNSETAGS